MMRCLLDGHVHFYPGVDLGCALTAGHDNLMRAAGKDAEAEALPCLLLTETARDDAFAELAAGRLVAAGWRVEARPKDPLGLTCTRASDGAQVLIVAGRQIVTFEMIEILAYGTRSRFEDGRPAAEVLGALAGASVPAALPWGLGKWIGRRGQIVSNLLAERSRPGLMLGDNAGRPYGWPTPPLFGKAASRGVAVLPGSDPLPLPHAEAGIGRYGARLDVRIDSDRPGLSLCDTLMRSDVKLYTIGRRQSLIEVFKWQRAYRKRPNA